MLKVSNLKFTKIQLKKGFGYDIHNNNRDYLGYVAKKRVGRFMHWCFFPAEHEYDDDLWFTNGCLKEIVAFITMLYSEDRKNVQVQPKE